MTTPDFRKDLRWLRKVNKIKDKLLFVFVLCLLVRGHSGQNCVLPCYYGNLGPADGSFASFGDLEVSILPLT